MEYPEDMDQALVFARQAIDKMGEMGVPANPNNFTIWFHYFSGKYPDLTRTLDILLGNKQEFTETRNAEIFQKFFTLDQESATLHECTNRVEGELGRILTNFAQAGNELETFETDVQNVQARLSDENDVDELKALSRELSATVAHALERNNQIEQQFKSSLEEINKLKEDLERMRREALTDGLTGIANRKLFDLELRKSAMHAMANGQDLSMLMFDIDHFKRFNEHYGHQVGDQVLKLVAVTISECIKGQDTAARYGGEEFAVILPRTNLENAVKLAEHICKRVSSKNVVNRATGERLGKITMSAGAGLFEYGEPVAQLLVRSDRALLEAKKQGRNRVLSQADIEGFAA